MKFALVLTHAGAPGTLATTALTGGLAEGFGSIGVSARVFVATLQQEAYRPETLGNADSSAPWRFARTPTFADDIRAIRMGALREDSGTTRPGAIPDWHLESLLEEELASFAKSDQLTITVHPRSPLLLKMLIDIASRNSWRVIVLSNEALTDTQIDPAVRDDYIALASTTSGIWAVSEYLASFWRQRGVGSNRILVAPGVVAAEAFLASAEVRRRTAVYVGNLEHREIEYLIEIAAKIAEHDSQFRLVIYGDSSPERRTSLSAEITARALSKVIDLMPAVPPQDVPNILASADVLLLPRSEGEFSRAGFPQKLGEYLASGRPVVVTKVGDIPSYLRDGENAFLVEADDIEAFARATTRALDVPALSAQIGLAGKKVAENLLRAPKVAEALLEFAKTLEPQPRQPKGKTSRVLLLGSRCAIERLGAAWRPRVARLRRLAQYTRSGHTRITAAKMDLLRILRALGLKPPAKRNK